MLPGGSRLSLGLVKFTPAVERKQLTLSAAAIAKYVEVWLREGAQIGHVYDVEVVEGQTSRRKEECDSVVIGVNSVR